MRKWLVVLMTAAAVGATGLLGWMYVSQDRKGPEITIDESKKGSYTGRNDRRRASGWSKSNR